MTATQWAQLAAWAAAAHPYPVFHDPHPHPTTTT